MSDNQKKKTNKVPVHMRLAAPGVEWMDDLAKKHRLDRTAVMRACLAVARTHHTEVTARLKEMQ